MKEIVVISGKGGTGKTSLTAAFATLATPLVLADCDVDAADLHLITQPQAQVVHPFLSGNLARINHSLCTSCGSCKITCRFEAVRSEDRWGAYWIDSSACEGCSACTLTCPTDAIEMLPRHCGELYVSSTRFGPLVHAKLDIGGENSGKLVTEVRKAAKAEALKNGHELILVDGPPGIGCAVIASITGADAIVAVTEPTISGRHDLERLMKLVQHFSIPVYVCVNKWDINPGISSDIETWVLETGGTFLGRISWDRSVTRAQVAGLSVIEENSGVASAEMKGIWEELCQKMK